MEVVNLSNENFKEEVLENKGKVLVDFYADWCGPCKIMSPVIDKIAEEIESVKVCKINVDNAQEIAGNYGIMSIPTIMVFEDGKIKEKFVGVTSKEAILDVLK